MKLVAFQGEPGAYSDLACRQLLGDRIETLPCRTFQVVFDAVRDGRARFALVPAENSTAGTVHEVFDLLLRRRLHIVCEHFLPVEHCLLLPPGASVASVRRVYSHPQALAQCDRLLRRLGAEPKAVYDTAGGARRVRHSRVKGSAAIASLLAARLYGLRVARRGVQDQRSNVTRFLLLGRVGDQTPVEIPRQGQGALKTSLVFETRHCPGALVRALAAFSARGINLTKIESRPIANRPFEYLFYVDVLCRDSSQRLESALRGLRRAASSVRVLGSYAPGARPAPVGSSRRRKRPTTAKKNINAAAAPAPARR